MIAKANAMNSTTFARGRTLTGYSGAAAVPRDEVLAGPAGPAARAAGRRRAPAGSSPAGRPGISHPGSFTHGPSRPREARERAALPDDGINLLSRHICARKEKERRYRMIRIPALRTHTEP